MYHNPLNQINMKPRLFLIVITLLTTVVIYGQTSDNAVTGLLLSAYSERNYTADPVTDEQIDIILKCGIKAPSAVNRQPWKFTVVNDTATMKQAIPNIVQGNVIIVISGLVSQTGTTPDFDCGLATENMFVAAHGLGLGARIYTGPVRNVNLNRDLFQIPAGYNAVSLLRIGNVDKNVDAVSAATPRKTPEEIINYKK
jgi:nitroreductase